MELDVPRAQDNFYLHVNKKWLEDPKNQIPTEYSSWGGFLKLHDEALKNQIQLVQELRDKQDKNEEEVKISAIWEATVAQFESWRNGLATYEPLAKELETLDSILPVQLTVTEKEHVQRLARYLHYSDLNNIDNVLCFSKGTDLTNSNNVVLEFSVSGLSLPSREYYIEENFKEKRDLFKAHLANVAKLVSVDPSTSFLDEDFAENVYLFEEELAKYTMKREQSREYAEYYTNTTLVHLHEKINHLAALPEKQNNYPETERNFILNEDQVSLASVFFEELYHLYNFREIMKVNLEANFFEKGVENPPIIDHVTAFDGDGIRRIFAFIANPANFQKYRAFLQYKVISALRLFCTKDLDAEFFDFYSRKLRGQEEQKPEDKRSILGVNSYAGEMLGKVYVAKYFPEHYKKNVCAMVQEVLDVMQVSLKRSNWLTEETKAKALLKLEKFRVKLGFPDVWKDYAELDVKPGDSYYDVSKKSRKWKLKVDFFEKINSVVDRNEWLMTPQTVNAYFMPPQNEIVFPAAILQPPFYCKTAEDIDFDITEELQMIAEATASPAPYDFTPAANYGGIGAVIAHEITHGYDDKGRKFDSDGNLNNWWNEDDVKLFTAQTEVMAEQAKLYTFIDTDDKEYKLNPQLTMGENLADLGGISLALQALTHHLQQQNASQRVIEINQRVFFKSFANIWKENKKQDSRINELTTDPHSPPDFRANLVKNMDEFYTVFNVSEADEMFIPSNARVRMW